MVNNPDNRKTTLRFLLGQVCYTPGAAAVLERCQVNPFDLLYRHQLGDWGKLDPEDMQANEDALHNGARILSSYPLSMLDDQTSAHTEKVWIITEADRSVTTILLPEDY